MSLSKSSKWEDNMSAAECEKACKDAGYEKKTAAYGAAKQGEKMGSAGPDAMEEKPAACGAEAPAERRSAAGTDSGAYNK